MRTVTYRLVDLQHATICIGFEGENECTRIIFDAKKAFEEYPNSIPSLAVTPPVGDPYPAVVTRDGDYVYWDIVDSDVAARGSGEGQLTFVEGTVVKKSYSFLTKTNRSIIPSGSAPSAINDWITRANAALGAIPQTIEDALAAAKASGEFDGEDGVGIQSIEKTATSGLVDTYTITLTDGRTYTYTVKNGAKGEDGDDGVGVQKIEKTSTSGLVDTYTITYTNGQTTTFTVTNGAPGDDGYSPSASVSKSGKVTTITITDKNGTTSEEILDGADGSDIIDDTAGVGDTNKTFSANKLATDHSSLLNALNQSNAATNSDIGKAHSPKTVENGQVTEWQYVPVGGSGLTDDIKDALLQCFDHVTWDDAHGDEYYADLYNALYPVLSITAVYDSTHTAKTSDTLNSLREYLTVTVHRDGMADATTNDYLLSGTLTEGTSTITVAYGGQTTTFTVTVVEDSDTVDVVLFAGQSNMDGRGDASEAPVVTQGTAYTWDASNNTVVDFSAERSLIPAFVKEYYEETGVPVVEVKKAEGGVTIDYYINTYLSTALTQLQNCITWLENNDKTVRRVFMLWNQGESDVDGDGNTGTAAYEASFATLRTAALAAGVEDIFIINIGQASNGNFDFAPIRTALQNVCNSTNTFMVCDKFYNATQYMKDRWHYNQVVYNAVGTDAAKNISAYFTSGSVPALIDFDASDVWGVPQEYGVLTDWSYTLFYTKACLSSYTGSGGAVRVYRFYKQGNKYYEARILCAMGSYTGTFYQNSTITSLAIDDGVRYAAADNLSDADNVQYATGVFREMAECTSITGVPVCLGPENAFRGSAKLETIAPLSAVTHGYMVYTFNSTKITVIGDISDVTGIMGTFAKCSELTSVGNISGTYTSMQNTFDDCTKLETVGIIGSTALTRINYAFINCVKLTGIVKFMSSIIDNAAYAFYGCDLSKIEIQVPANSTTYTTITTAYPNANVTTF